MQPTTQRDPGKYKLLAELGRGGMANVYLAVARGPSGFNKLVVLKALRSDLANDRDLLAMFLDEARLAARLNHPHVVQTYEVGEYAGRPVLVMEYLEGQTLAHILARARSNDKPMPLPLHLRVIIDTLDGLHHAHELTDYSGKPLGLVHRDVSPQNVFITFDGQVKVLDFGIAKVVNAQAQTSTGVLKGKVKYMAPEQMLGAPLDRRADIYAVGVMIWEAAVGQRMWQGQSDLHVMNKVANEGVPTPSSVEPSVTPEIEAVCMKALARNPDDRYASAVELGAALEGLLASLGGHATSRNLGKLVRELFEDARAHARSIIEAQLLEVNTASDSASQLIPQNLVNISTTSSASVVTGDESQLSRAAVPGERNSLLTGFDKPGPRRALLLSAMGLAAFLAAAAVGFWTRGSAHTKAQTVDPVVIPPSPAAPPSETASSTPPVASSAPTPSASAASPEPPPPAVVTHEQGPRWHPRTPTPTPATSTSTKPQVVDTPPPPKNNKCNPPYFIDSDGIKKFKPECL